MRKLLLLLLATAAITAFAQTPPSERLDPKTAWDQMLKASAKISAASIETTQYVRGEENKETEALPSIKTVFQFKRPNSFRLEQNDLSKIDSKRVLVISDNGKLYLPFGESSLAREGADQMNGMFRYFNLSLLDEGLHLLTFLGSDRELGKFYRNLKNAKLIEKQTWDSKSVNVLSADYVKDDKTLGTISLYLGADDHLLMRYVIKVKMAIESVGDLEEVDEQGNSKKTPSSEQVVVYDWRIKYTLNPSFEEGVFKFGGGR